MNLHEKIKSAGTLEEMHALYSAHVIPAAAGEAQRRVMRHAFYAGASSVVSLLTQSIGDDEDMAKGVAQIEAVREELNKEALDIIAEVVERALNSHLQKP